MFTQKKYNSHQVNKTYTRTDSRDFIGSTKILKNETESSVFIIYYIKNINTSLLVKLKSYSYLKMIHFAWRSSETFQTRIYFVWTKNDVIRRIVIIRRYSLENISYLTNTLKKKNLSSKITGNFWVLNTSSKSCFKEKRTLS